MSPVTAAGSNGANRSAPAGAVDFRRFRTWDAEPAESATPTWRILARYGYVRLASSWAGRTLLIVLTLGAVLLVGGSSYALATGEGVNAYAWMGAIMMSMYPLAAILLLVGGPLFADDLRFNAPLFYFSKPVRVGDYFAGKLAFLGSLVGAAILAPVLLLLLLALFVGIPAGEVPDYSLYTYYDAREVTRMQADWYATHIDTVPEWGAAAAATVPALVLVVAMFTAVAVACSVYTRRGWHAGMAFVALVGGTTMAGAVLSDSVDGAMGQLFSPFGWAYLMVAMPLRLMFSPTQISSYELAQLRDAGTAIPLAYVLALTVTGVALWASLRRMRRLEASL